MKKFNFIVLAIIAVFLITGCADTVEVGKCVVDPNIGFWKGLWHGRM